MAPRPIILFFNGKCTSGNQGGICSFGKLTVSLELGEVGLTVKQIIQLFVTILAKFRLPSGRNF